MNTCGYCSCADYRTYTGQLQIIGFSTTSAVGSATIASPACSFPLSMDLIANRLLLVRCFVRYLGQLFSFFLLILCSGTIAFNFKAALNGGGSRCYAINGAISTGQSPSLAIKFTDDTGINTAFLSDMVVKFTYPSQSSVYYGGSSYAVCSGWSSLSYWPTRFNTAAPSSTTCNYLSSPNTFSLSAGFTGVCIMNVMCTDYRTYSGQLQIIGFSTTSAVGPATIVSPACSFPLSMDLIANRLLLYAL